MVRAHDRSLLVVEDDVSAREAMREMLELQGYRVFEAGAADDACRVLDEHHVDAVVSDIILPGGGLAVVRKVARSLPSTPVIVISSRSAGQLGGELSATVFEVLRKPVRFDDFLKAVRRAIDPSDGDTSRS